MIEIIAAADSNQSRADKRLIAQYRRSNTLALNVLNLQLMKLIFGLTQGASAFFQLGRFQLNQLLVALLVSCLLHAALLFSPSFKGARSALNITKQSQNNMSARRVTNVQLTYNNAPTVAAPAPVKVNQAALMSLPSAHLSQEHLEITAPEPVLAPVVTTYYTAEQLTKRAYPSSAVELDVSELKSLTGSGRVVLKLWINDLGEVTDIEVEKTELPNVISDLAIQTFRATHFVPGEINGQPVDSLMRIEINYDDDELDLP